MTRRALAGDKWQLAKDLFSQALELDRNERRALVEESTDDPEVRSEVLDLLANHQSSDAFLEPLLAPMPEPGESLGRYRIIEQIGGGGMGDVYRADDLTLGREVAIKVLRSSLDETTRERFDREARAVAALSHRNILAIHDVGVDDSRAYLVTELLVGETLRERLEARRPSISQACAWASDIAAGLAAAHDKQIVHRDLKPENVFVQADGTLKILDFGLAERAERGQLPDTDERAEEKPEVVLGTAGYLAPEQARGKEVGPGGDLFALGTILYEMVTGERAFRGESPADTVKMVVSVDVPPASVLRPSVPSWLDAIIERALKKELSQRFESARDFAFALELGQAQQTLEARPTRRGRLALVVASVALAAAAIGWFARSERVVMPATEQAASSPPRTAALTNAGRDKAPTVSRDGRFMAFVSDRDGVEKIWLQQLDSARERALTEGPDYAPRFSPDGAQILFTRTGSDRVDAIYRTDLLGGAPRKVVSDATDGDWSPSGQQLVYVRWVPGDSQALPKLMVANIDGSGEREVATLDYRAPDLRPRWSPDGKWIAATGLVGQPGAPQKITLIDPASGETKELATPKRIGLVSAVAWQDAGTLLYSQAVSVLGNSAGSPAQVVRQSIVSGTIEALLWTPESSQVLEVWRGHGLVYDARSAIQNLREVSLATGDERYLSRGTATDRQPVYSPDGKTIVFASSRSGNLDLWTFDRESGEVRRLTDNDGDDWDPAFTADGQSLLWSSSRGGHFEVWIANADGTNPRQVTSDGLDAENPTAAPDGEWIVYATGARERRGIWKIRSDGTEATMLVPGAILPQISPDGTLVLFQTNRTPRLAVVGVVRVSDGEILPFEIKVEVYKPSRAREGRGRWTPDGKSIAFIGQDPAGNTGVFLQAYDRDAQTGETRRPVAGFDAENVTESFDISSDSIVLAEWEQRSGILATRGATLLPSN